MSRIPTYDAIVGLLARNWWAIILRGAAGIVFGLLALIVPGITLAALVLLFGAYALVDGIFTLAAVVTGRRTAQPWWALLLEGIVSIGAGLAAFLVPGLTALALVFLVGVWAVVRGVLEIAAALRLRKEIENEWWLGLAGALSVVFGVLLMVAPGAGALALVLWVGAYALVFGVALVVLGLRLRGRRPEARRQVRRAA